jgi:hypothetical protein
VVLRLEPGCSISGRVVDSLSGEPADADLVLAPAAGQEGMDFSATLLHASRDHGFALRGLTPAVYT